MSQVEKIAIAFDEQAREILNNIYPELRNAAVNIAVKMLAKDPMYHKYFCIECENITDDEAVNPEQLGDSRQQTINNTSPAAVQTWDDFI